MKTLTLITVPIGNLGDITQRALDKLNEVKHIVSEDTRKTKSLLNALGISYDEKKIHSFHDHSSDKVIEFIIRLLESEEVALVSDAGSPAISDPAYPLVDKVLSLNGKVSSCPGACSMICALELSGFAPIPFHFHGFLSRENGKQKQFFQLIQKRAGTHMFYESPNRVIDTLENMAKYMESGRVCLARELTKVYETVLRFDISKIEEMKKHIITKGEFVVMVNIPPINGVEDLSSEEVIKLAEKVLENKGKKKDLSKLLAKVLGKNAKQIYGELDDR